MAQFFSDMRKISSANPTKKKNNYNIKNEKISIAKSLKSCNKCEGMSR